MVQSPAHTGRRLGHVQLSRQSHNQQSCICFGLQLLLKQSTVLPYSFPSLRCRKFTEFLNVYWFMKSSFIPERIRNEGHYTMQFIRTRTNYWNKLTLQLLQPLQNGSLCQLLRQLFCLAILALLANCSILSDRHPINFISIDRDASQLRAPLESSQES